MTPNAAVRVAHKKAAGMNRPLSLLC